MPFKECKSPAKSNLIKYKRKQIETKQNGKKQVNIKI